MSPFAESVVEEAALAWLEALGYAVLHGPDMAVGQPAAERHDPAFRDVLLKKRLRNALLRLNPDLPPEPLEDAYRKLTRAEAPTLIERNRAVHRMLGDGVPVEYRRKDGSIAGAQARVIDFETPENNDWLAVNQFTVSEGQHTRRPDVVLFVNGLPLAVIELKNPADENATIWSAHQQLETYQEQIPALFTNNAALVVSDGAQARVGALGAGKELVQALALHLNRKIRRAVGRGVSTPAIADRIDAGETRTLQPTTISAPGKSNKPPSVSERLELHRLHRSRPRETLPRNSQIGRSHRRTARRSFRAGCAG
ncbi:MAG TPA: type I restriction endonuclease [Roseiarcus sp.]|nr:type I restriction endonuclease [Roseiarcus sp.]